MPYRTPGTPEPHRRSLWQRLTTLPCKGCDDGVVKRWSWGTGAGFFGLCPLCVNLAAADAMRQAADDEEAGRALFASAMYRRAIRKPYD